VGWGEECCCCFGGVIWREGEWWKGDVKHGWTDSRLE